MPEEWQDSINNCLTGESGAGGSTPINRIIHRKIGWLKGKILLIITENGWVIKYDQIPATRIK